MPVHGDEDEEPPFRPLTPEQQAALDERAQRKTGILGDGELKAGKYNMRMVESAIKRGWNIPEDIRESVVAQMAKIVAKSEEDRNQIAAARVLVSADGVNVAREKLEQPQPQAAPTVNVAVVNQIQVNETDDWYGTQAARRDVAESDGSPTVGDSVASAIQGGGVRPALGQNGTGTNGHAKGPRRDEGPAAGSN